MNAVSRHQQTPLHFTAHNRNSARVISMFVEARAHLETHDITGKTPLHDAALFQSHDALLVLLNHGAETNAKNKSGKTPLHLAALEVGGEQGGADLVDLLLRAGADETIVDYSGQTAADIIGKCVEEEDERLAGGISRVRNLLANAPADRAWRRRGYLVLCRAHPERVQLLLRHDNSQALVSGGGMRRSGSRGKLTAAAASSQGGGTGGYPVGERTDSDWTTFAAWMLGVKEDGIFRMIVGYL